MRMSMIEMMMMIEMILMTMMIKYKQYLPTHLPTYLPINLPTNLPSISRIRSLKTFFLSFFSTVNRPSYMMINHTFFDGIVRDRMSVQRCTVHCTYPSGT